MTRDCRRALAYLLVLTACSSNALLPPPGLPVTGAWGGDHLRLTLSDAGGELEYDCARGVMAEPLRPDANGAFDIRGFHFRGQGGPVRQHEPVDSVSARYTGTIRDNVMKLDVRLPSENLGPYTLAKGGEARVVRCL